MKVYLIICHANGGFAQLGVADTEAEAIKRAKDMAQYAYSLNTYLVIPCDSEKDYVAKGKRELNDFPDED